MSSTDVNLPRWARGVLFGATVLLLLSDAKGELRFVAVPTG